ncbi:MAG: hypothetical protein KAS48_03020 [Gammaproteobacteria bacterium]|nr:hypothetical protein [Gammaproteobacteria bacterium]
MKRIETIKAVVLAMLLGFCSMAGSLASAEVPTPDIPKGEGEKCVEPTDIMRKNHMEYLLHQRDETMRKGIRTKTYSLKECVDCHTVKDENNIPVTYKDKRHFCNSCHEYASVQIDCFSCHSSTPEASHSGLTKRPAKFFNSTQNLNALSLKAENQHE